MLKRLFDAQASSDNEEGGDFESPRPRFESTAEPALIATSEGGTAQSPSELAAQNISAEQFDRASWFDTDAQAFLVSLLFHVVVLLALAVVPIVAVHTQDALALRALPAKSEEPFSLLEQVAISDEQSAVVGANSDSGTSMSLSMAPVLAELSEIPSPPLNPPVLNATLDLTQQIEQAVGLVRSQTVVKGMTGVGTTGTDGAVDRITYEILRSMEERPTLVVWFFDQSGSLQKRREEIRNRFDRIYEELGIIGQAQDERGSNPSSPPEAPLLTSIFAFGAQVNLLTQKPTADIDEIRAAIDSIMLDESGIERVFSALYKGVEKFKRYRTSTSGRGSERNVLFIAVTDERGDDANGLEATIKECRKFAIPVYVIGVPAPFGRDVSYVKYVDPDPKYDQSPQWAEVDQGPESVLPERVKLGYRDEDYGEPVIDSGFGPYALSRLTYETGGIYFTVHPNRRVGGRVRRNEIDPFASQLEYFFDPEKMSKYRPDYVSTEEYLRQVRESPLREVLTRAANLPRVAVLNNPTRRFVKRDEASVVNALTQAQQQAARLEPPLAALAELLKTGQEHRDREVSPRWIAGYDLALGTVLAHKVRAEAYNAMLAQAKRGMNFEKPDSNTWVLQAADEITVGSRLEKEAELARELLTTVADKHQGTPWGLLASRELGNPIGWKWVEDITDLNPPPRSSNATPNNTPRPARDDEARMLEKPPLKRPLPKL